jgi:dienelactone hydrolase
MLIVNAGPESAPRYDPRGWMHWPDNEEYSDRFMQILGSAQEGSSTISECFLAATRITPGDDESWYREWKKLAGTCKSRGDLAVREGNIDTAKGNWLRASNYFRAAEQFLGINDRRRSYILDQMQICSHLYLGCLAPKGEVVQIPAAGGGLMHGYFLRAPRSQPQTPVVICVGGPDHLKEEHLYKMPRHAHARKLSLLLIDLPGQGVCPRRERGVGRNDIETSISCWVDYLASRSDVDAERIAIFGEGLGAAFASQAAGAEHRISAAVCDAGIWDLHERAFLLRRISGCNHPESVEDQISKLWRHSIAKRIRCPILATLGECDWLKTNDAVEYYSYLKQAGIDISVKIFQAAETAASHAQIDNPTIGNEFIFDWIAARLGTTGQQNALRENDVRSPLQTLTRLSQDDF